MPGEARIDWGALTREDWLEQDVVLAGRLGCSRERVRQARLERGGGVRPSGYRRRTRGSARLALEGVDTDGMTLRELAGLAGCSTGRAAVVLAGMGRGFRRLPPGRLKYEWGRFPSNWRELTDKEIGEIVGVGNPVVVTQWRLRHGYVKEGRRSC